MVGVAISLVLLVSLLWTVNLAEIWRQLQKTQWGWTLVSAALAPIGLWIRARRWSYLFPPGSKPPALVPAMMIGYMVNNILPLRAGEIVRVRVVARRWGQGFWMALATLVVERVLDSLVLILVLGVLIFRIPVPATLRWAATILLLLDVIVVAVLALLAVAPAACERVLRRAARRWPGLAGPGPADLAGASWTAWTGSAPPGTCSAGAVDCRRVVGAGRRGLGHLPSDGPRSAVDRGLDRAGLRGRRDQHPRSARLHRRLPLRGRPRARDLRRAAPDGAQLRPRVSRQPDRGHHGEPAGCSCSAST